MVAGIPGAGIGGLFYLLSAFTLPFRMFGRWLRGERGVFRQRDAWLVVVLSLGVVAGVWATGWLLGAIVVHGAGVRSGVVHGATRHLPGLTTNAIRVATLLGGFLTLAIILGAAEVGAFALARKAARDRRTRAL